jgi:hypothetical protein
MEPISNVLPQSKVFQEAERTLQFTKRWLNRGFTQVNNGLLRNTEVSHSARYLYILLMSRCFSREFSYPGETTLSKEMGVSEVSIISYKKELEDKGWIKVKRRGQGKTNLYFLDKYK